MPSLPMYKSTEHAGIILDGQATEVFRATVEHGYGKATVAMYRSTGRGEDGGVVLDIAHDGAGTGGGLDPVLEQLRSGGDAFSNVQQQDAKGIRIHLAGDMESAAVLAALRALLDRLPVQSECEVEIEEDGLTPRRTAWDRLLDRPPVCARCHAETRDPDSVGESDG